MELEPDGLEIKLFSEKDLNASYIRGRDNGKILGNIISVLSLSTTIIIFILSLTIRLSPKTKTPYKVTMQVESFYNLNNNELKSDTIYHYE